MLTTRNDNNSRKYGYGSHNFLPTQCIHTHADTNDNGNKRLHIGVHTDKCWAQSLLPYRDKEIGYECGADNQETEFCDV